MPYLKEIDTSADRKLQNRHFHDHNPVRRDPTENMSSGYRMSLLLKSSVQFTQIVHHYADAHNFAQQPSDLLPHEEYLALKHLLKRSQVEHAQTVD